MVATFSNHRTSHGICFSIQFIRGQVTPEVQDKMWARLRWLGGRHQWLAEFNRARAFWWPHTQEGAHCRTIACQWLAQMARQQEAV